MRDDCYTGTCKRLDCDEDAKKDDSCFDEATESRLYAHDGDCAGSVLGLVCVNKTLPTLDEGICTGDRRFEVLCNLPDLPYGGKARGNAVVVEKGLAHLMNGLLLPSNT